MKKTLLALAVAGALAFFAPAAAQVDGVSMGAAPGSSSIDATAGAVTAASTTNLAASSALFQTVSGGTTITSFGTGANITRFLNFTGAPLLTNGSNLVTGTGANIQACPGDRAQVVSDNSGTPVWTVIDFKPAGTIQSAAISIGISTSYAQAATVTLACGRWEFTTAAIQSRGTSINDLRGAISTTTASSTGTTAGITDYSVQTCGACGIAALAMPVSDVTVTSSTPYYFNVKADANSGTFTGLFRAKRIYLVPANDDTLEWRGKWGGQ